MEPKDPSYPLYPIACIICALGLALVLATSFIRQGRNIGIFLLCSYLFLYNFTAGINAIIWADNSDIKLLVYCDIGAVFSQFSLSSLSHLTLLSYHSLPLAYFCQCCSSSLHISYH